MSTSENRLRVREIEAVLAKAYADNRRLLYEHEVYEVLSILGLTVPTHIFIRDEEDITAQTLSMFPSSRIVLKVVSGAVAHKQKMGGVKIAHKDLDFIKYTFSRMKTDFSGMRIEVEGILLVEHIDYSKDLGNETLLGFRESDAFGPVISFSKGGTDAEHFATYFSSPNLILAPVDREWSTALHATTKIQKKFIEEGSGDFIERIIDAEMKLSELAVAFSSFFESGSGFCIKEFEINPIVFDRERNFIALDGYATFDIKTKEPAVQLLKPKETLKPFFEPEGVAIIGVSASDHTKAGNIIAKNLFDLGRDDIYFVNVKGGEVDISGKRFILYRSVLDIDRHIDLAVITIPAEMSVQAVKDCIRKKTRAIILIPGGFSEINKNRDLEAEIYRLCDQRDIRVMGPNCIGVIYDGEPGINTFFIPEDKFSINMRSTNKVAIISQSGALGITEIFNLRNAISPKVVVSYGNQLDIDPSDLVQYFDEVPLVNVIGLYIEGFKKGAGRRFFDTTSRCKKPIVVYKAGRTEVGKQAARSHTASIAGEYEIAKAAMKQAGLIVADSMIDHGDLIKTFALMHNFKVYGNRVVIIANAGYEKTYAADNLADLTVAELDSKTLGRLNEIIPPYVSVSSLMDLTAMASDELFEQCIDTVLASDTVDALCVSIVPQAVVLHTTDKEIESDRENVAARIVQTVQKHNKPVAVSVNVVSGSDAAYNKFGQVLDAGGVPTYLTAERAMYCLNAFIRYRLMKEKHILSDWLR